MNRFSPDFPRPAARARWLADLLAALDEASALPLALFDDRGGGSRAIGLRAQIVALRGQVSSLQCQPEVDLNELHPDWTR